MDARLTLPGYREEFVRLLYAIIAVEFVVITILLFGFSNEYLSNAYMRDWIGANQPFLGILLHGEVDSLFIGGALGALVVLVKRSVRAAKSQEDLRPSIKPSVPDYTSTSSVQDQTRQNDPTPGPESLSRAKPNDAPPQINGKELKKTDS